MATERKNATGAHSAQNTQCHAAFVRCGRCLQWLASLGLLGEAAVFAQDITPPTISDVANQSINEDQDTGALSFTVGDAATATASLTVTATSSNTTLVPNTTTNLILGGSDASRTLTPALSASGSATIAVTSVDNSNGTWQYATDGSTWTAFSSPSESSVLLLSASDLNTRIRIYGYVEENDGLSTS